MTAISIRSPEKTAPKQAGGRLVDGSQLRAFIAETAPLIGVQANLLETYAALGDDAGARYAFGQLVAYVRACGASLVDLETGKARAGGAR